MARVLDRRMDMGAKVCALVRARGDCESDGRIDIKTRGVRCALG